MCSDKTSSGLQILYCTYLFCVRVCVHAHMHSHHACTCDRMRTCHGTYVEVRGITSLFCHVGPRDEPRVVRLDGNAFTINSSCQPPRVAAVRTAVFNAV